MKLWAVTIERTIMVLADSDTEAEQLAQEKEREECLNDPDFLTAIEANDLMRVPPPWRDCIPYGGTDDLNCQQILESAATVEAPQ